MVKPKTNLAQITKAFNFDNEAIKTLNSNGQNFTSREFIRQS